MSADRDILSGLRFEPGPPSPVLYDAGLDIWRVSLSRSRQELETLRGMLSEEECRRADRFRFPIHRARFVAAHGVLRGILGRYLGVPPSDITYLVGSHGKPRLPGADAPSFNLSHSGDWALVAVTGGVRRVGVDIERVREMKDMRGLSETVFTDREIGVIFGAESKSAEAGFFRCWTRKEAMVKALGRGLHVDLKTWEICGPDAPLSGAPLGFEDPVEHRDWYIWDIEPVAAFRAAVVAGGGCEVIRLWDWSPQ